MIDLKWLTAKSEKGIAHVDLYKKSLKNRGEDEKIVDELMRLDSKRKKAIQAFEEKKAEQNKASQAFSKAKKLGEDSQELLEAMKSLSSQVKELEHESIKAQEKVKDFLSYMPNHLDSETPVGKTESDNVKIKAYGEKPNFTFNPKEHWELGESSDTIDFERAGKVSGARFSFLKGDGARLERALIQFMLDQHTEKNNYQEVFPPLIVNADSLYGTGNFPKFKEDVFKIEDKEGYLIPTAEVPLTNLYAGEILNEIDLPQKFAAYTPCFRSEAGSYGKDTKGLIRQHQFNKVELVKFCHPDHSDHEHTALLEDAESILKSLHLHYEVVSLCSGDISFGAQKCYDINVWLPGQNAYREISSCSNFGSFQARRANIRFKPTGGGKPEFVHTLNGSGLASGRTLVAIYENYQQEDGSIAVPEVLVPYMNGKTVIGKR